MSLLFLIIIYLAFISLGLPDSLLGSAWPVMRGEYGAALSAAGIISMIISLGTIFSSLASGSLLKKLGTGKVTFISCLMTASALLGFSISHSFLFLLFLAAVLGLGAGSVDAGLNHYVANHYKAKHMSWLHCFWGIGATFGPVLLSFGISKTGSYRSGYLIVALIQASLTVLLFFTLPLWKRSGDRIQEDTESEDMMPGKNILKIRGIFPNFLSFFFYCGAEATVGLWGSSFLIQAKGITPVKAAQWISFFYAGITIGRLAAGFLTKWFSNKILILSGELMALLGVCLIIFPLPPVFSLCGILIIGIGFAPIYPCMLHETPARFGRQASVRLMGWQMAVAYTGTTFLPPILGFIASKTTILVFPFIVLAYILFMLAGSERLNSILSLKAMQQ